MEARRKIMVKRSINSIPSEPDLISIVKTKRFHMHLQAQVLVWPAQVLMSGCVNLFRLKCWCSYI